MTTRTKFTKISQVRDFVVLTWCGEMIAAEPIENVKIESTEADEEYEYDPRTEFGL